MDLEDYTKWNKSARERETNTVWFLLYMESKKRFFLILNQAHKYRGQTGSCQRKGMGVGSNLTKVKLK